MINPPYRRILRWLKGAFPFWTRPSSDITAMENLKMGNFPSDKLVSWLEDFCGEEDVPQPEIQDLVEFIAWSYSKTLTPILRKRVLDCLLQLAIHKNLYFEREFEKLSSCPLQDVLSRNVDLGPSSGDESAAFENYAEVEKRAHFYFEMMKNCPQTHREVFLNQLLILIAENRKLIEQEAPLVISTLEKKVKQFYMFGHYNPPLWYGNAFWESGE